MRYRLLLDENMEKEVASRLDTDGHDVERVRSKSELGSTADDDRIVAYARRKDRIVLTDDDDFLSKPIDVGVLYVPDESLSPGTVAAIVRAVASNYPQSELDCAVFASENWL